jgi:hypothetical protein
MPPYLSKITAIGIKSETTQNTAVTPSATDFTYAWGVSVEPVPEMVPSEIQTQSLDQLFAILGSIWVKVKFKLPMRGSGTAGTELAPLSAMMKAAGMSATAIGGTSVSYLLVSAPSGANFYSLGTTATVEVYKGATTSGKKHIIKGAVVSSLKAVVPNKKFGYWEVEMLGLYTEFTEANIPATTYNVTKPPQVASVNFTLLGVVTVGVANFELDYGLETTIREDFNSPQGVHGFMVTGRKPKFKCDPEVMAIATLNAPNKLTTNAEGTLSLAVSGGAGNITTISAPKAQLTNVQYGDRGGIFTYNIEGQCNVNAGDDSVSVVLT